MAAYSTETITPCYHQALLGSQTRNFPELEFLHENWGKFFGNQAPYDLNGDRLPLTNSQYLDYLAKVLPDRYGDTDEFRQYSGQLLGGETIERPVERQALSPSGGLRGRCSTDGW